MRQQHFRVITTISAAALVGLSVSAGDPTPPAGPIAPTAKPLTEVEPRVPIGPDTTPGDADSVYRVAAPGSYYLTGDVVLPVSGKIRGIEIAASDVTIDLNGFSINGEQSTSNSSLAACIRGEMGVTRVTIKNGSVIGSSYGLHLAFVTNARVHQVSARRSNLGSGFLLGDGALVTECRASGCTDRGFSLGAGSVVERCVAIDNDGGGFFFGGSSSANNRITDSIAVGSNEGETPSTGIDIQGVGGLVANNYVASHMLGIRVQGTGYTVVRNVAKANINQPFAIVPGNHAGAVVSDPAVAGPWDNIGN